MQKAEKRHGERLETQGFSGDEIETILKYFAARRKLQATHFYAIDLLRKEHQGRSME